jgi:hypothetical protein
MTRWILLPERGTDEQKRTYSQVLAVHAALLHTDRIIFFSGDEHSPGQNYLGLQQTQRGEMPSAIEHTRLFNCSTLEVMGASSPESDVFCSGHALLFDGSLLVAGGTERYWYQPAQDTGHHEHFTGLRDS